MTLGAAKPQEKHPDAVTSWSEELEREVHLALEETAGLHHRDPFEMDSEHLLHKLPPSQH